MDNKKIIPFIEGTKAMFIERASWNDDVDVNYFKDVNIKDFYYDYINDDGILYDCLDFAEDFAIVGHYTELEKYFNEVRDTLWMSGIIQQVFTENKRLELDCCYNYIEETTWEMCPHCEHEVELSTMMKYQPCPHCGIMIALCSFCNTDYVKCSECPLDKCKQSFKAEDVNYIIMQDNGEPLKWDDNGLPVIYGGLEDAEIHWQEGDTIMTLGKYAKNIGVDWRNLISD